MKQEHNPSQKNRGGGGGSGLVGAGVTVWGGDPFLDTIRKRVTFPVILGERPTILREGERPGVMQGQRKSIVLRKGEERPRGIYPDQGEIDEVPRGEEAELEPYGCDPDGRSLALYRLKRGRFSGGFHSGKIQRRQGVVDPFFDQTELKKLRCWGRGAAKRGGTVRSETVGTSSRVGPPSRQGVPDE